MVRQIWSKPKWLWHLIKIYKSNLEIHLRIRKLVNQGLENDHWGKIIVFKSSDLLIEVENDDMVLERFRVEEDN